MKIDLYLACPYTSGDRLVRAERAELATLAAAHLMTRHGKVVFSPITHGHAIAKHMTPAMIVDSDWWQEMTLPFLHAAEEFVLLPIAGWRESLGVQAELRLARQLGKTIRVLQSLDAPEWDELIEQLGDLELLSLGNEVL